MSADCEFLETCSAFQNIAAQDESGGYADDATWVLTSSFVILTMQSGFGLLEIGNSMAGHEVNIMLKNVVDVVFGALAYFSFGYGISYGNPSIPFMGLGNFFPDGKNDSESGLLYSRYLFQFSFAATSTTIVSGCIAMRLKFFVYCIFSFYAVITYSFVAHWVWGDDGWLFQLGVHDFAGGGPVHLLGGVNGLIAILFVGPRKGRFDGTHPESYFAGSSPTSMLFGLFMLWWGWIGFNCGSSFGITGDKWLVATRAGVTTINSTAAGGSFALLYTQLRSRGKYVKPAHMVDGILGSLVAITPACACCHTWEALIIGMIGAFVGLAGNDLMKILKLDDPVGAVGVHAGSAMFGLIAVGLFTDSSLPGIEVEDGLFRGGGFRLLGVQVLSIVSIIGWSIATAGPFFYFVGIAFSRDWSDPRKGLRIEHEDGKGADHEFHGCVDTTKEEIISQVRRSFSVSFRNRVSQSQVTVPIEEEDSSGGDEEEGRAKSEPDEPIDRRQIFSALKAPPPCLPSPKPEDAPRDKLVFFKSEPEYVD